MPEPCHPDDLACSRFVQPPSTPTSSLPKPSQARRFGLSYIVLSIVAAALLTANATILQAMSSDLQTQKRQAQEASKPAEIELTAVTAPSCQNCFNLISLLGSLSANEKVKVVKTETVDYASAAGASIVKQYNLERAPAFIIKGETDKFLTAVPTVKSYGVLQDGDFVGKNTPAPYVETATGKVRGEFQVTYITEKQCAECYDPTVNRQALGQLGMRPTSETTVDRADPDGQKLVKQYSLTTTPTVILTGDLAAYVNFDQVWKNVGTAEPDGAYVFRSGQALMGTYYDLVTKKAIAPKNDETNTNTSTP
ncbi:MAG: hypothetical protein HY421_00805 [Candidatus Kerfeldbacteria bacterium]|nr:hypothetical protein [Candidatus Kerfeldbacteria bacterium]